MNNPTASTADRTRNRSPGSAAAAIFRPGLPKSRKWSTAAKLFETDAVLASVLATCDDCIKILDLDGRVLFCNEAGLRAMEIADLSLLRGRCWNNFWSDDAVPDAAEAIARAARGQNARFAGHALSARGNVRYWDVQLAPILNQQGVPTYVFTIARNMTEQRRLEQRQQTLLDDLRHLNDTLERRVLERTAELAAANEKLMAEVAEHKRMDARLQELQGELYHAARLSAAGQMATALAHELNQPLTAAISSIAAARRLLISKNVDLPTAREVMDEGAEEVRRAGEIIRRLRDFVARGETEKRFESVTALVEEASALSLVGADAAGVVAHFRFDPNTSMVFVDRIQIQQVLTNLLRNAIEAMAGRPERELEVSTAAALDGMVEIAVSDTGPGLSKHVADQLFRPFVSTKRHGMGLGLSICRSIIQAHGGRLWSEANPAGGTVFRFTLAAGLMEHAADAS